MAGRRPRLGFTLIELVLIILILGALAVFAAPRLNIGGFNNYTFRQEVVNALRYAQKTAVASRCDVQVDIRSDRVTLSYRSGGTSSECGNGDFTETLPHPSRGGHFVVRARRDAAIASGTGTIEFDGRGSPDAGVQITFAGGDSVAVIEDTGFIDG